MRRQYIASLLFLAWAGCSRTNPEASVRREIEAVYRDAVATTLSAHKLEQLEALRARMDTPDWISVDSTGARSTWQDMRASVEDALDQRVEPFTIEVEKVTLRNGRAIVLARVGITEEIADETGRFGPAGQKHKLANFSLVRDTWIRTGSGWRRQLHEELNPRAMTVDGKPFEADQDRS